MKSGEHINPDEYKISDELKNRINDNNNSSIGPTNVADFKKLQDQTGDGGFFNTIKSGINALGSSGKDYTDKFDAIIQLLTTMVSLMQGGAMQPATAGGNPLDSMTAAIPIMKGNDKMVTTTPGKSILNMLGSMLHIAEQ